MSTQETTVITVVTEGRDEPRPEHDACLIVLHGVDLGRRFALRNETILLGRSGKTDIQLDEDAVSRHHALIEVEEHHIVLRDLNSTNGTWVNDLRVHEVALHNGDLLRIGRTIFKVLIGSEVEASYHEEVYRLATTDGLTQMWNKRYFLREIEREIQRTRAAERPLSVLVCDLDHFKRINDTWGHLTGDFVLKHVATTLSDVVSDAGLVARWGGEEFTVLLPNTALPEAARMAEHLRAAIAAAPCLARGAQGPRAQQLIPLTLSIGVAQLSEILDHAGSMPDFALLKCADDRLFTAKREGRNRVIAHDPT